MTKTVDSPNRRECQENGTGYENVIIADSYNADSALLNISSDSSATITASLPPTNFYFTPVKTINPFESYHQKLTKPKKSPYFRLGWF
jgi:hypothetical protein